MQPAAAQLRLFYGHQSAGYLVKWWMLLVYEGLCACRMSLQRMSHWSRGRHCLMHVGMSSEV